MTEKGLKIALICREASLSGGGVERYALCLSRDMVNMGHTVHVFANHWDENIDRRLITHKIQALKGLQSLKLLSFIHNCRRQLRQCSRDIDIVCSLSQFYPQDVFRLGGAIQNVLMERKYPSPWKRWFKYLIADGYLLRLYLEQKTFEGTNSRHVVAISKLIKKQLTETYNVPEERVSVIYNGVDLKRFNPAIKKRWRDVTRERFGLNKDDIALLFVGHDFRRKGLDYAIKALSAVDKRVKLLVAGKDNPGSYKGMALSLNVEDRVIFLGAIGEMESIYAASDIFIFPTLYDAFGSVGLEAMACGLPVIATKYSGFSELIENHINGVILSELNADQMQMAINNLIKEDVRTYLSENGVKTAMQFTTIQNAKEMLRVFYKVLDTLPLKGGGKGWG